MPDSDDGGQKPPPASKEVLESWAPHPYQSLTADGEILSVNDAWLETLGFERDEVIGRWFGDLLTADSKSTFESQFEEFKASGEISAAEFEMKRSDGDTIVVSVDGKIEYDENGQVVRTHCQFWNVTDWKRTEHELGQQQDRLRAITDTIPDIVIQYDAAGTAKEVMTGQEDLLIAAPEELEGSTIDEMLDPTAAEQIQSAIDKALQNREVTSTEYRLHIDGEEVWFEAKVSPLGDQDPDEVVFSSRDITERKAQQRELRRTKERLELAIEGANLGIWDWDMQSDKVVRSDQWAEMLGYSSGEIINEIGGWEKLLHPEDREPHDKALNEYLAGEKDLYTVDYRLQTADDEWKWIRNVGKVMEWDEAGNPVRSVGIHQDIDEQKRAERARKQSQKRLRQIIDLVPDPIFLKNHDGEYLLANAAVGKIFGLAPEEMIGKTEREMGMSEERFERYREEDREVIESGESLMIPERQARTADGDVLTLQTILIPYESVGSDPDGILGYARNITERTEYERALERQRDDLELLNQVVRHDIRNDLQLVLSYAEMLEKHVETGDKEYVRQVLEAARDAVDITETARDVTEILLQQQTERSPVDLKGVLEHEIQDVRPSNERALITVNGTIPQVEVLADNLLESVFRNLLSNAINHNDKEVPEVTVSATTADEVVRIRIADNGPGIPDEQKERIFEQGETGIDSVGTGIGLYLVQTLVDRYGGQIWIEDNDPEGSVFVIELPIVN
ncbi:PAS domain-containing sensor histidine kinase [Halodesulfurarchaeum sp.]|uniref:PAS domain-containing sensor histidine kinase n=1 Tax=Halodesulfurarchaeum sp. TaxID=1980530 RepID=UPI002FC2876F